VYVCVCRGLTESEVRRVAATVEPTPSALISALGLDHEECCGRCATNIRAILYIATRPQAEAPPPVSSSLESHRQELTR
jgi:bacterioferritin-associated ferredoxin